MPFAARIGFFGIGNWAEGSGGNTTSNVTYDGINYNRYDFTGSGSFSITEPGILRIMAIGGGGSGGDDRSVVSNPAGLKGGGGGAGEFYDATFNSWDLNGSYQGSSQISILIGAGGPHRSGTVDAENGSDTTVGSGLTVKGGGGGAGLTGASGGGGMAFPNRVTTGGSSNITNIGGKGNNGASAAINSIGGGGGGAGGSAGGSGGANGFQWIDGTYYAGGGGGGDNVVSSSGSGSFGGLGGGGKGRGDSSGVNKGGGESGFGGGGGAGWTGGAGRVVILVRS
mgnify:CR=1 FL=1